MEYHVIIILHYRYDVAYGPDMSGAYLFKPSGEAVDAHVSEHQPTVYIIEGHILSQVIIQFSNVKHTVLIRHTIGKPNFIFLILKFSLIQLFKNIKMYSM